MQERVLLASPVRQEPAILLEFLESLRRLDHAGIDLDFAFVDDGNSHRLLQAFAAEVPNTRISPGRAEASYVCDEQTHYWREDLIWKVAAYKNRFLDLARAEAYDYVFLVDSDLYLQPPTLNHLLSLRKDIVAEVFWTKWQPNSMPLPQVWVAGQYTLYEAQRGERLTEREINERTRAFLDKLRHPGTYKVGMLGACTLLSRGALTRGVSFSPIYNLDLWGEDRHFCIRAAALNLELYADTHFPPFHIYRESDLVQLSHYKQQIDTAASRNPTGVERGSRDHRITLAMLVRNEAGRYLDRVLRDASRYIDAAVILDDASEDNTVEVCETALGEIPRVIKSNPRAGFANEVGLRKQLWQMALATDPDWVLVLDADEIFEPRAAITLPQLARAQDVEMYSFRLYDMWNETCYREDTWWCAHKWYRPFMVRCRPGIEWVWRETPLHCGRLPLNVAQLSGRYSELRLKHLGWMKAEDRLAKYRRYQQLDPNAIYGLKQQYGSILDPNPRLLRWEDIPMESALPTDGKPRSEAGVVRAHGA